MSDTTKKCSSCKKDKVFSDFYKMKVGTYGLDQYCKECRKKKNREYQQRSKDRRAAYMREYREAKKAGQLEDFLKSL